MKYINKKLKPIIAVLTILTLSVGFFLYNNSHTVKAAWWNSSWGYRKSIAVTHSNGSALTDFQVKIMDGVDLSTDIDGGKIRSDLGDIRFTDLAGTVLDYWIEDITATTSVNAWIVSASVAESDTVYFYYGNSGTSDGQDGEAVFEFFDDFSGSSLDSGKWLQSGGGTPTFSAGEMTVAANSTDPSKITATSSPMGDNYILRSRFKATGGSNVDERLGISIKSNTSDGEGYNYLLHDLTNYDEIKFLDDNTAWGNTPEASFSINTYYIFEITHDGTDVLGRRDDGTWYTETWSGRSGYPALNIGSNNGITVWDYAVVRKYASSEPVAGALAGEETAPSSESTDPLSPVGYWSFDEGYGTVAHDEGTAGNDGTFYNGADWKGKEECISGKCVYLDGIDQTRVAADIPDNESVFTACSWFKSNSLVNVDSDTETFLLGKRWELFFNNSGRLTFWLATNGVWPEVSSNVNIKTNKWYHVCGVSNGAGSNPQLFLNGVDVGTAQDGGSGVMSDNSSYPFQIGASSDNEWDGNFEGHIDEVKVYPYARSADQVKQDYNAGLSGVNSKSGVAASFGSRSDKWMSDGLVGYWKMDEISTSTAGAIDSTGNGSNGVYEGIASTTSGKYGRAASFNGVNSVVSVDDSLLDDTFPGNSRNSTEAFSFCYFVKYNSLGGRLLRVPGRVQMDGSTFGLVTSDGGGYLGMSGLTTDIWQHVVGTYDGQYMRLYLDGKLNASLGHTGIVGVDGSDFFLGAGDSSPSTGINGLLDEVRIYNRALSKSEVRKLYEWAPGPVLHLKMDEKVIGDFKDLYDSSGFGNDGSTLDENNPEGVNCMVRGKYGTACDFDGDGDLLRVGTDQSLEIQNHTMSAWIYPRSVDYSQTGSIASKADNILNAGVEWAVDDSNLHFAYNDGSLSPWYVATSSNIEVNKWQHVAINWNRLDGEVSFYVDGIKTDTVSTETNEIIYSGDRFEVGNQENNQHFDGIIDDLRVYNYTRTQKQILEDMNGGKSANKMPVLHLSFDEGYGSTANDSSIYRNNGILTPGGGGSQTTVSSMWDGDGRVNGAMEFDGTDDYVDFGDGAIFEPETISYGAWLKVEGDGSHVDGSFALSKGRHNAEPYESYILSYEGDDNVFKCSIGVNSILRRATSTTTFVPPTDWVHVICAYDGSDIKVYINGVLEKTENYPGSISYGMITNDDLYVGKWGYSGSWERAFDGKIDEVKIWNYTLSDDEIKEEYNSGQATVMGADISRDDNGTTVTGASKKYCIPGDTSKCSPPVLELKMDEKVGGTIYDTSGNGNDGVINGATYGRGRVGAGLEFDGVDDYVRVPYDASIYPTNTMTLSAWVKIETLITGPLDRWKIAATTENGGYSLGHENDSMMFVVRSNDQYLAASYPEENWNENEWYFITGIFDGVNAKLYKNGIEVATDSGGDGVIDYTLSIDLLIGMEPDSSGNPQTSWTEYFDGQIDDVKIYNYARTPAQIAWDYNEGAPVAHWKFDECSGSTIHDEMGGNNHGTLDLGSSGVTATGTCASSSDSFWYNGKDGKNSYGGSFDGVDDRIVIGDNSVLDIENQISLSVWVYLDGNPTVDFGVINKLNAYSLEIEASTDCIDFSLYQSSWSEIEPENCALSYNVWHHLMAIFDGDIMSVYQDGELIGTLDTSHTAIDTNSNDVYIGFNPYAADRYFDGKIDDVKIFNYALTGEQVKNVYNGGAVSFR